MIFNNDIAIIRTPSDINFIDNLVKAAFFAGTDYILADYQLVWTAGWGYTEVHLATVTCLDADNTMDCFLGNLTIFFCLNQMGTTEQLRDINLLTINQNFCTYLFEGWGMVINENMFCAGWLGVSGIGQCSGDSSGPVYHNGIVVGVTPAHLSGCGMPERPGVNVRVSRYINWIRNNA